LIVIVLIIKYIRVQNETEPSDMIEFLYNQKGDNSWDLTKPQLILSVTGGAQKFTLPYRMKKAFKRGLVKAAASTGAWIITGGTNTGVMRLVGEAVAEEFQDNKLTVLGIATWGKIALRDKMIVIINCEFTLFDEI
jgi:transient receptor potential cation channel subfamily M protein 2